MADDEKLAPSHRVAGSLWPVNDGKASKLRDAAFLLPLKLRARCTSSLSPISCPLLFLDRQLRRKNIHGCKPALAKDAQAKRVMALGQPAAVVVNNQPAMIPGRRLNAESAKQQNLPCG